MKIYLASKSPRRQLLLKQIGIKYEIVDVDINEHWDGTENVRSYVERMSLEKARAGKIKLNTNKNITVFGADTAVVLDDKILGKAQSNEDATQMLKSLSGRMHHVYSAVSLVTQSEEKTKLNISRVCFRPLTESDIENYCKTGEPLGKAGAYAIQGKAAAFIERLDGSYSGVMGLPLFETTELLKSAGIV
ncbi:MAG: septum formation inhibitor Maf [Gammaproteobacteria bacterium]|nr:septum formation inhibitor Maf [Gammaproteobacteria bacterium]